MKSFELDTLLAILQQSEYEWPDFQKWVTAHQDDQTTIIKPEKWTAKLKLIKQIISIFAVAPFLSTITKIKIALAIITPFENIIRHSLYSLAKLKLSWYRKNGLQVIAIAGSYAKTSTKHSLTHILGGQKKILMTPKSINTLLGITHLIFSDLTAKHQLFIVEFGEYNPQDIKNLTAFLKPDYGILTPIGRQHLERFGTVEEIAKTFQPLVKFFKNKPEKLLMSDQSASFFENNFQTYGQNTNSDYHITSHQTSLRGTEFTATGPELNQSIFSPLFGVHQAANILPSLWLGKQFEIQIGQLLQRISTLPSIPRRHQPFFGENNVLVLDNSYNTNPDSAKASLALLDELEAKQKLILTLGFTELGKESKTIHRKFGERLAKTADYLGLIQAPWTEDIIEGYLSAGGKKSNIITGSDFDQTFAKLQTKILPNSVVLFEGGYREVYV